MTPRRHPAQASALPPPSKRERSVVECLDLDPPLSSSRVCSLAPHSLAHSLSTRFHLLRVTLHHLSLTSRPPSPSPCRLLLPQSPKTREFLSPVYVSWNQMRHLPIQAPQLAITSHHAALYLASGLSQGPESRSIVIHARRRGCPVPTRPRRFYGRMLPS